MVFLGEKFHSFREIFAFIEPNSIFAVKIIADSQLAKTPEDPPTL
jgi:hypothetical protein